MSLDPEGYVIIGGGCYGSYYVRQLLDARERGMTRFDFVVVLDQDPECEVARGFSERDDVEVHVGRWEEASRVVFARERRWRRAHLVPAPIAPHIVFEWTMDALVRRAGLSPERISHLPYDAELPELPFAALVREGTLVLSHAPGMCPINCIEPRKCPLTSDWRDWEMRDTLLLHNAAHQTFDLLQVQVCHHRVNGVGTIPLQAIFDGWARVRDLVSRSRSTIRIGIATVSACHGILDLLQVAPED